MLIGDLPATKGTAYANDYCLDLDLYNYQRQIGYCGQFDALVDYMSGREMLYLFARLRGIPEQLIPKIVKDMIILVGLEPHANKRTSTYSGGNKRKLSLGMAIIGSPPVVFLDEPTTGVDPAARRRIWTSLTMLQKMSNCALVLTSHSMDECEALCYRIGIMVAGHFKCLGSPQQLRSKYGQGYSLVIKLKQEEEEEILKERVAKVEKAVRDKFPASIVKEVHEGTLEFHLADKQLKWSHMFRVMEEMKTQFQLEDYVLSDTTLEQIFLSFAKGASPQDDLDTNELCHLTPIMKKEDDNVAKIVEILIKQLTKT